MRPKISEFSYGYALTENLIQLAPKGLTAAPMFPSLIQEGKSDGGFDLKLSFPVAPVFLQFKLSDYMKSTAATEYKLYNLFSPPFFRMHLRALRHSSQHKALLELESKGNLVYYAAPMFWEEAQLNQSYATRSVAKNSVYFRPKSIGKLPDDGEHHIAFQQKNNSQVIAYRLSEPVSVETENVAMIIREIVMRLNSYRDTHVQPNDLFGLLYSQMLEILNSELGLYSEEDLTFLHDFDARTAVSYLARTFFGCELLLFGETQNTER